MGNLEYSRYDDISSWELSKKQSNERIKKAVKDKKAEESREQSKQTVDGKISEAVKDKKTEESREQSKQTVDGKISEAVEKKRQKKSERGVWKKSLRELDKKFLD